MVVRVQAQDQSWVWLYMVLQLQPGEIPINSNNYIIRYLPPFLTTHQFVDERMINAAENTNLTPVSPLLFFSQ